MVIGLFDLLTFYKANCTSSSDCIFKNRVATLPGILEKPWILTIFTCSVVKFRFHSKNLSYRKKILSSSNFFKLKKNIFKVALQYLFNVVILLNTVSYLKLNLRLKIDPEICIFKHLEEIQKTWNKFLKNKKRQTWFKFWLFFFVTKNNTSIFFQPLDVAADNIFL